MAALAAPAQAAVEAGRYDRTGETLPLCGDPLERRARYGDLSLRSPACPGGSRGRQAGLDSAAMTDSKQDAIAILGGCYALVSTGATPVEAGKDALQTLLQRQHGSPWARPIYQGQ